MHGNWGIVPERCSAACSILLMDQLCNSVLRMRLNPFHGVFSPVGDGLAQAMHYHPHVRRKSRQFTEAVESKRLWGDERGDRTVSIRTGTFSGARVRGRRVGRPCGLGTFYGALWLRGAVARFGREVIVGGQEAWSCRRNAHLRWRTRPLFRAPRAPKIPPTCRQNSGLMTMLRGLSRTLRFIRAASFVGGCRRPAESLPVPVFGDSFPLICLLKCNAGHVLWYKRRTIGWTWGIPA